MKKALMLGVVLLAAAGVKTASAAEYGFYNSSGGAFCDGVKYAGNGVSAPAVGQHIYDQTYCVFPDGDLGGFTSTIKFLGAGKWLTLPVSLATGDEDPQAYTLVFYLNTKALTWQLYYESTDYGVSYGFLNSGILQKGAPFAAGGQKLHESTIHAGLVKAGLIKAK